MFDGKTLLKVDQLTLEKNGTTILNNINLSIPKGKITIIIGQSGAGKTSLLRCFNRLNSFQGTIYFDKNPISNIDVQKLRQQIVYVSQQPSVFPGTVRDNILWGLKYHEASCDEKQIEDVLDSVGLDKGLIMKNAHNLSLGQQQRIHFARSLMLEPKLILLDEPASALDAIATDVMEKLILSVLREDPSKSIVMITHNLHQAKRIADYCVLLEKGVVVIEGIANEFFIKVEGLSEAEMLKKLLK